MSPVLGLAFVLTLASSSAWASPDPLSGDAFQAQIAAAVRITIACAAEARACDPAALPPDSLVSRPGNTTFHASWLWLREALADARGKSAHDRQAGMHDAADHLKEISAQTAGTATALTDGTFVPARTAAAAILSRSEFAPDAGPSWFDRQLAKVQDWFLRLLLGMDRLGTHHPWLAPLIEWTCFLLAAGGLVFSIRRTLARSDLRIALGAGAMPSWSGRESTDWARLGEEHANAGRWRDAVHCLYWAAIVSLESRRAWRPNPTRTPREYLQLLPPSTAGSALRELTRILERVWYGGAEATETDFNAALAALSTIASANLKRDVSDRPDHPNRSRPLSPLSEAS